MSAFVTEAEKREYLTQRGASIREVVSPIHGGDRPGDSDVYVQEWQVGDRWFPLETAYRAAVERDLHTLLTQERKRCLLALELRGLLR